jgi:hypothetical protein
VEREIDELLLPAARGGEIGAVAVVVGRLFAPTTSSHRLKPRLKQYAASQARLRVEYLGNLLAIYQQHEGISEEVLAERLGRSGAALDDLLLCLRPEPGEEEGAALGRYVRQAADVAGVAAHLLGAALRDALRFEQEEEIAITQRAGESGSALLS